MPVLSVDAEDTAPVNPSAISPLTSVADGSRASPMLPDCPWMEYSLPCDAAFDRFSRAYEKYAMLTALKMRVSSTGINSAVSSRLCPESCLELSVMTCVGMAFSVANRQFQDFTSGLGWSFPHSAEDRVGFSLSGSFQTARPHCPG